MAKHHGVARDEQPRLGRSRDDVLFEVLSAGRRRAAMDYLRTADTPVKFADLVTEISHREREASDVDLGMEKWEDIRTAMAHAHLPILDDGEFVDYDEAAETIDLGERAPQIFSQLDAMAFEASGPSP